MGAGAWGTTIANICAENGHKVTLWCYQSSVANAISTHCTHHRLPNIQLCSNITTTTQLSDCYHHDLLILGLSSAQLMDYANAIEWNHISSPIVALAKGIIEPNGLISQWLSDRFSGPIGSLSGPNLALEIAQKKPAASVIASTDSTLNRDVQQWLSNHYFRVYTSTDINGVQCGGIFKNVIAIAAGVMDGLHLGTNAKSALITRSLVELQQLFDYFNADASSLWGLSGLGDLMATCSSKQSRNWQFGFELATHRDTAFNNQKNRGQTEGLRTIHLIKKMVNNTENLPIINAIETLINDVNAHPMQIIQDLIERGLKSEFDH
jgi:glycerol-3-phosphate dehydrogenase (NAD(P)+)